MPTQTASAHSSQSSRLESLEYFTLGYQLRPLQDFVDQLLGAEVGVVVDVRETPWSRKRGFSKGPLESTLEEAGIEYLHARFAGNPKEFRRNLTHHEQCLTRYEDFLSDRPDILDQLTDLILQLESKKSVCFICYERHPGDCHRDILLRHWAEHTSAELSVKHLGVGGAPRLVKC